MKILKSLAVAVTALIALSSTASAYLIDLSVNAGGGGYVDSGGTALTTGTSAYGYFDGDPTTITAGDLATVQAAFNQVASTTTFGAGFTGNVQTSFTLASNPDSEAATPFTSAQYTSNIAGKDVYNLVISGGEYGLFLASADFASGADGITNNITIASFWQNAGGSAVTGHGGVFAAGGQGGNANQLVTATAIPEPTTAILIGALLGVLGLTSRRRRRCA